MAPPSGTTKFKCFVIKRKAEEIEDWQNLVASSTFYLREEYAPRWPGGKATKIRRSAGPPRPMYAGARGINSPVEQDALSQVLPYSHLSLATICSALKYCDTNYKNRISSDISLTT